MKLFLLMLSLHSTSALAFGFKFTLISTKASIKNFGLYRAYSSGSNAKSCDEYRNTNNAVKSYSGDIGDGLYRLNPDNGTPFIAYCDMTSDSSGIGWTLIMTGNMTANYLNTPASVYNGTSTENYTFQILNGVTMNQNQLMQVINRMPFTQIKLPAARILNSLVSTSTFSTKYNNLTGWTSTMCKTAGGGYQIADESYGWNVSRNGSFTNTSATLGCLVGAGSPNNNMGYIDYAYVGIGVRSYATASAGCVVQSPYGYNVPCNSSSRYLVGYSAHRMIDSYHTYASFNFTLSADVGGASGTAVGATTDKARLIWIR